MNQFDLIADAYAIKVEEAPNNAYYERPATLKLVGDVLGKNVLDIGCGTGIYADLLLTTGAARVVALDISEKMIEISRRRLGDKATLHVADVSGPLPFLQENYFDIIICPLVLHYVEDLPLAFKQLITKLKEGGKLIFSVGHPFADFKHSVSQKYFDVELIEELWPSFNTMIKTYRRSLMSIFTSFEMAGFVFESLVEPQPLPELALINENAFLKLSREPGFICFKISKPYNEQSGNYGGNH